MSLKNSSQKYLGRDLFRETTFKRDGGKCVFCEKDAVDAHHILERRLWSDGGYYLDNGASVCEEHHMECEKTNISVEEVRAACEITRAIIPDHLYMDQPYDKWGNPILPNGQRLKGELFHDESVQKVLGQGGKLGLFTSYVKYPRTHHLPWSEGVTDDDRIIQGLSPFEGKRVVVTEKMDGENTSMYSDYIHARSLDGRSHVSRSWVKQFWSSICGDIPSGWRICGENLYAKHSIEYKELPSFFIGFSIWNDKNECLSWDETLQWFNLLGITPAKVLYDGIYSENDIKKIWNDKNWETTEGYVLRIADQFSYGEFKNKVAKFVRKGHVQTAKHWMYGQPIENNVLAEQKKVNKPVY